MKTKVLAAVTALTLLPLSALPASAAPRIDWKPCATEYAPTLECASLRVSGVFSIALAKLPATDAGRRVGSLLTNPGGPGGSGVTVLKYGGRGFALDKPEMAEVRQRFDVIGFDPRGVGASTPAIACGPDLHDPAVSRFPKNRADYEKLIAHNRVSGAECLKRTGPALSQVDTWRAADDVESIRTALGEPKVNWLGVSYGSELGAVYAEKYPKRVRTMVLDGAVDHSRPTRQAILDETIATEGALNDFAKWCTTSAECVLRGKDVLATYDALMRTPGGVPAKELGRNLTAEEMSAGIYGGLILPAFWPAVAQGIADSTAEKPDASALAPYAQLDPSYGAYRAIGCHDFGAPFTSYADMKAMQGLVKTLAPHAWRYSEFWDMASGCAGWPVASAYLPRPQQVRGAAPILVVGGEHDPATPLVWARGLARNIENSTLLVDAGYGHTGLLNSACVRDEEVKYLVSGVTPAPGKVCR
ncbi:alpha/beta hydrolase [Amycolatopsis regifaucium]|uniref:Alpha/beta hydrolase n=1 Tax=Amycolatopsis regifaucium TaxID=546365 RepID=A0A154ML67_9PSEU|nr:alpha/beta hydrolase [Amycolatopsis regifaucium]KZB85062.1 alpha/beta hydrolase [Amycolatopsis regifaucium]OKA04086.1 alpha/beta hydrolase [Amycolatopsis regifaucium]SFH95351.1 TAP-like protein [Amycolatopsis regifaucium]